MARLPRTPIVVDQGTIMAISATQDSFVSRAKFEYKYCLWPRQCYNTKRFIWFRLAVRGRAVWTGPGEPVVEDRWFHRNEGLMIMIKKVSEQ